ncbi:MAG TPA: hypothetical protein P5572_11565, partial [Phycisphaerae bacterium]|nr:hypothetical protein [Phycisphaerae bacterium]
LHGPGEQTTDMIPQLQTHPPVETPAEESATDTTDAGDAENASAEASAENADDEEKQAGE